MAAGFVVGFELFRAPSQSWAEPFAGGLGTAALLAAYFALYPQLKFKPQVRTLTFLPAELQTTIKGESKTYPWTEVARIEEDAGFVVIGLKNLNAFIIPPRAFGSVEARSLVAQCNKWRAAVAGGAWVLRGRVVLPLLLAACSNTRSATKHDASRPWTAARHSWTKMKMKMKMKLRSLGWSGGP